jgi:hypothetical protein
MRLKENIILTISSKGTIYLLFIIIYVVLIFFNDLLKLRLKIILIAISPYIQ